MSDNAEATSMGFLSTYPPTSCGLATFTKALRGAIADARGSDDGLGVVGLVDDSVASPKPEVVYEHHNGDRSSLQLAVKALNQFDVAIVQHEFGIYGGNDGEEVLDLLSGLDIPAIVTLHTVLSRPSPSQKSIMEKVSALADRTVVMSETARHRLTSGYEVDPDSVRVIPHGATTRLSGPSLANGARPVVLTWGLIGPGKGLEIAIDALARLTDIHPSPRYLILGETHPKVRASQGDVYLDGLISRAQELGLGGIVEFDGRYLDPDSLARAVRQADVVVLPYESTEQVTSGVLVEALAAGKPVIATAFPHAAELLSTGAGIVVPHRDPQALATALRHVLTQPERAAEMAVEANRIAATLYWPAIAQRYDRMAAKLLADHRAIQPTAEASVEQKDYVAAAS